MGSEMALVFYGNDGLDELTTVGTSSIYRLKDGVVTHAEFTPADFGVAPASSGDFAGGEAAENAAILRAVLGGETGPKRDIAVINAAAAIVAAGLADGFADGIASAAESIDSGHASAVLEASIRMSDEFVGN